MGSALALLLAVLPLAQDPAPDDERAAVEKLVEQSVSARAVIRPQAAARLVAHGALAADVVRARAGEGPDGLADLGADLVEVLPALGDDDLRARTWEALRDLDFPWRPAAARGLAASPADGEAGALDALLDDHIAAVRAAVVPAADPAVLPLRLADPDGRVRRAAAERLGHVPTLLAELRRTDTFFARDVGKEARFEAARMLARLHPDLPDLRADLAPGDPANEAAWAWIEERWPGAAPAVAPAPADDVVLGVEVRSCRRGEFFVRVTADDVLLVGLGDAARVPLPAGTADRLVEEVRAAVAPLGDDRYWGRAGCDLERLLLPGEERLATYHVQKGPDAEEGLRPAALGAAQAALVAALEALPAAHDDPRARDLRARLADAVASVGGALPE